MKIETSLDLENRTAIVTIHADTKIFRMTYELDKVAKELEALSSNIIALKVLSLLGFKIEMEKKEPKPSAETTQKPA